VRARQAPPTPAATTRPVLKQTAPSTSPWSRQPSPKHRPDHGHAQAHDFGHRHPRRRVLQHGWDSRRGPAGSRSCKPGPGSVPTAATRGSARLELAPGGERIGATVAAIRRGRERFAPSGPSAPPSWPQSQCSSQLSLGRGGRSVRLGRGAFWLLAERDGTPKGAGGVRLRGLGGLQ
jgi:hypothetical protein